VNVAGYDATLGLMRYMGLPADQDCLLVEVIKRAGGVPFTKTNIPQTLISYECSNPLFGTCTNPWNVNYTPGGSSGGESALIAYRYISMLQPTAIVI
jgi:fatty acid amide hydrolase